jgi:integrative and conjugative element protein (TIGR02256 family)
MKMVFQVTLRQRLVFTEKAVAQMNAFRQGTWMKAEAGGVLLGRHLLESPDIVVDEVTVPQKLDLRSRFSFFRSKQHGEVALARWLTERQTLAYLGLWHTHPETDPNPSGVDRNDWEQAVAKDSFDGDRLFFPIVGIERIRVWTKSRRSGIRELTLAGREAKP